MQYLSSKEQLTKVGEAGLFIKKQLDPELETHCELRVALPLPNIVIICGTGLSVLANEIKNPLEIFYKDIPHCPTPTAPQHENGKLVFGQLGEKNVVAMVGRFHCYEGYSMFEVTFLLRTLLWLGVKLVVTTNATGGINPNYKVGDIMLVRNHNSFFIPDPLIGPLFPNTVRFPDTSNLYNYHLSGIAYISAKELGFILQQGILVAVTGPCYENQTEIEFLKQSGCDAVGMSVIPEAKVAASFKIPVVGFSIITNILSNSGKLNPATENEVTEEAEKVGLNLAKIIQRFLCYKDLVSPS